MTTIIDLSTADKMKAAHDAIEAAAAKRLAQPRSLAPGQCICRVCGLSEVGRFVKDSKLPGNFECINECENEFGNAVAVYTQADFDEGLPNASEADIDYLEKNFPRLMKGMEERINAEPAGVI
jgi:hypothetical protein